MAIFATFIGENADGYVRLWGHEFRTGEPVAVTDPFAIGKIHGNSEFTFKPVDPLDHDMNGKKGGSRRGKRK